MTSNTRRVVVLVALVPLAACGDTPTGPSSTAAPPAAPQQCRRYATAYTSHSSGPGYDVTSMVSCSFDRSGRVLRCTESSAECTSQISTFYASVEDFIEEAAAVGRERLLRRERVGCNSLATTIHTYDAQKRLVASQFRNTSFEIMTTFTGWDAAGRPTQETSNTLGACSGSTSIRTYDDAARTVTSRNTSRGSGDRCGPGDSVLTVRYDADGNRVRETFVSEGVTSYMAVNTVQSTESACP